LRQISLYARHCIFQHGLLPTVKVDATFYSETLVPIYQTVLRHVHTCYRLARLDSRCLRFF